jgi:DNA-binding Lrp family transcriptional regulator
MPEYNALSNVGTSKVFLSIILGKRNPKTIADFLGIKPPPVIEQFRRLQKMNIIELGEKDGKQQNYRIKWHEFLTIFIDILLKQWEQEKDKIEEDYPEQIKKIKSLADNKYFKQVIETYLRSFTEIDASKWDVTVNYLILYFEKTLIQSYHFNKKTQIKETEKKEFFKNMKLWRDKFLSTNTWRDASFNSAIEEILKTN